MGSLESVADSAGTPVFVLSELARSVDLSFGS